MANANLRNAKKAKNDEFYTVLTDIEKELVHYVDFFNGKVVYCNCDDARESNFFKYFSLNFEHLGLKKLITTGFKADGKGVVLIYEGDKNGNRMVEDSEIITKELEGNGDFRSAECIEFLKECDVVVTNPPFSLFREYVAQLMEYGKKFIILGNNNSVTCKEIFQYIKNNKLWLGTTANKTMEFSIPYSYEKWDRIENGVKIGKVPSISWYTNIPHSKRNTPLDLYRRYSNEYIKFANLDAINCKVSDIPIDYDGIIGVPVSFLENYCPTQFEILATSNDVEELKKLGVKPIGAEGISLLRSQGGTAHLSANSTELYYIENGKFKKPFSRILIRKKNTF